MAASSSMISMTSSSTSGCEISSSPRRREAPSSSSSLSAHHDIFLSHSGAQKPFVKDLYKMLSPPYTPFFDIYHHSLPPGENFPKRILDAAKTCKLAVVVLSDEYLLSRWPMIELCAFVNAVPKVNILPLFYKLSPENLKHSSNVKKWHKAWKVHAKSDPTKRIVFSDWVQALRHLSSLNGLVFRPSEQGEGSYLEEIVSCIYKQFPLALKYEDWGIHGKERLCEIILAKFRELDSTSHASRVCMLGMYGLLGTGKSTLSRCLRDHFFPCFHGKSFYLELPTNPTLDQLLNKSKELLRSLPGFHNMVHLTNNAFDIHQVYNLFKSSTLPGSTVFLVVDNISSGESVDFVQHLLRLGFGRGSKVLLVARTLDVLKPLLQIHHKKSHYVCSSLGIPTIDETEAMKILLERGCGGRWVEGGAKEDGLTPRHRQILKKVVSMSSFGREHADGCRLYIPLVLKMMGNQLRRYEFDVEKWGREIESFWKKVEVCKEDAVRQLVQESFESLPKKLQLLFLDIALFVVPSSCGATTRANGMKESCYLLSTMHESYPERIEMEIFGLRQYCFVEIYGHNMALRVHDMYLEFATSTRESCMYYSLSYGVHKGVKGPSSNMEDQLSSAKAASQLRAIILELDHDGQETLEFSASLSSVRALVIRNSKSLANIMGLAGLTSLVSLEIHNCPNLQLWSDKATCNGPQGLKRLGLAKEQSDESYKGPVPHELGSRSNIWLQAQQLSAQLLPSWMSSTLLSLSKLQPQRPEIGSFASQFRGLQSLILENTGITRLQGTISMCWPQLQELQIVEPHLEHFELGNLPKLKRFLLSDGGKFPLLKLLKNVSLRLEDSEPDGICTYYASSKAAAGENRALGEKDLFAGCPDLEDVRIMCSKFCGEGMGTSLSVASKLHTLWIRDFYSSSSFPSLANPLPQSVEMLLISHCDVRNVNFGWRFGSLRELRLISCPGIVAISGLEHLPNLSTLEICDCRELQTVSGLSGLVSLESLRIVGWACVNVSVSLSELENLARLREIQCFCAHFVDFLNVAKFAGKLEKLKLCLISPYSDERADEYYSGSPVDLSALLGLPKPCHLSCLDSIHQLHLGGLQNLVSLKGVEFLVTLESLFLTNLQQLTSLQGMECLVNLQRLCLRNCVKVKSVEGCNAMTRLFSASFSGCRSLASLPLDFEFLRRMPHEWKHYKFYWDLRIEGCAFATEDAMVTWALDENVPVLLRVASLRALALEFHTNLLGMRRERAALLARVGAYFLEQIFQWHEDQQYCLAFAECADELEERWNDGYDRAQGHYTRIHGHRISDEGMRRKVKEATELLRGLAKVPKQQVLQRCRSDCTFQLAVVECIAQLDKPSPYLIHLRFRMFEEIANYCARVLQLRVLQVKAEGDDGLS